MRVVWCPECNTSLKIIAKEGKYDIRCPKCQHKTDVDNYLNKPKEQMPSDDEQGTDLLNQKKMFKPCILILEKGNCDTQKIILKKGMNTIGRKSSASQSTIQLDGDEFISKNHAAIEVVMKKDYTFEHRLSDRNSTNGTYYNGMLLEPDDVNILMPGDIVGFGKRTLFKVVME
jgi:pSer/pThr/pTyr-binding forkhead associated (FHA) protein